MVSKLKSDLKRYVKPKKTHGFYFTLFLMGLLFPPWAVATRFGIGRDFFINLALCLLGYFPSHFHNFYLQNIRNNNNAKRTPRWAKKYGLVSDDADKKKAKMNQWANRYEMNNPGNERILQRPEDGQYEESDYPLPPEENGEADGAHQARAQGERLPGAPANGPKRLPGMESNARRRDSDDDDDVQGDHEDEREAQDLLHPPRRSTDTSRARRLKERNGYALPPQEFMNREYDGTDMGVKGDSEANGDLQHLF